MLVDCDIPRLGAGWEDGGFLVNEGTVEGELSDFNAIWNH
jgi:hypothetical protein